MQQVDSVLAATERGFSGSLDRLFELLRIPSISTDPAYKAECRRAGQWLVKSLKEQGFKASLRETPGHPNVVAHKAGPKGSPHVLFYGHYDVQPADPLEKWATPPFEPVLRKDADGAERIYARGAEDDKGQLMTFLEASRAWIEATGGLPLSVTVLIEGEEESGSENLAPFLSANREELTSEIALVCDTGMWDKRTPAITTRLRGLVHEEIIVTGPRIDLHSGAFGGAAHNAIHVLARIIADLRDENGRIMIPGFYDGVAELPEETRRQWEGLKFSEKRFLGEVGLTEAAGERDRSVLEKIWSRPTAEVNGVIGGYTGVGGKTVIPSKASAKFTFRLVGKQDPARVRRNFRAFVKARLPKGCKVEFLAKTPGSKAIEIPLDNPMIGRAAGALAREWRRDAVMMGCGGSIPIVRAFKDVLRMDALLIGFGLPDDAIHSPNEKYDLTSYRGGIRSWVRVIGALADGAG